MRHLLRWLALGLLPVVAAASSSLLHGQGAAPSSAPATSKAAAPAVTPPPRANPRRSTTASGAAAATEETKPAAPAATAPLVPPRANPQRVPLAGQIETPKAETAYRAKLKAALAPLITAPLDEAGIAQLKDVLKSRNLEAAKALGDPVARKLALWRLYRVGLGTPDEIAAFPKANPAWPDEELLLRRAEEALFTAGGSSDQIKAFFKGRRPVSGAGWASLASAHLAEKNEAEARKMAAQAWADEEMAVTFETGFLARFGNLLDVADHRRRLDRILIDQVRFRSARNSRAAIARRTILLLPEGERAAATARLSVFLRQSAAPKLMAALPPEPAGKTDWGLAYARVSLLLRANKIAEAAKILTKLPDDADLLVSADDWWLARREAAYDALKAGDNKLAYALVKNTGPLSVNPAKEQNNMAGWIALRLLKKPADALAHFEATVKLADGPLSRAEANYWTGRTLAQLGQKAKAKFHYQQALRDQDTFHALLSRHELLGAGPQTLPISLPAAPTAGEIKRFLARDGVRAAALSMRAGLDRNYAIGLFAGLRNHLESEGELAMLAELASSLDDPQTSLRVGKTAIARGFNLVTYAYPIDSFPPYVAVRTPPETALLLAVARQETEFNIAIVSHAGARGLLQVMPITARHVCQTHKLQCDIGRLLRDHAYNARIASAYIGDRMAEFDGHYVVTLPGYNAGPGRARQWMRQNGDPRTPGVDPLDWIERIPFEETRNYVQKVLSNLQIYRARLGEAKPLRLIDDLTKPTGLRRADRAAAQ